MKLKNKIFLFLLHLIINGVGLYVGFTKILESVNVRYPLSDYLWTFGAVSMLHLTNIDKKNKKEQNDKQDMILAIIFTVVVYGFCYFKNGKFVSATIGIMVVTFSYYLYNKIDYHFKDSIK